jgi:hypothetical protein
MPAAPTNLEVEQLAADIPHAELSFDHDGVDTAYYEIQKREDGSSDNYTTFALIEISSPDLVEDTGTYTVAIPSEPDVQFKVIAVASDGSVST